MYAIVDIAGQQFKVEKEQKIFVHRLEGDEGSTVSFDRVLLIENDGKVQVGTPVIKGTVVTATIVAHLKGDKVKVFKKKRRKGYQVLNGHRQSLTEILIENIGEAKVKKTEAASKPVDKKDADAKAPADKEAKAKAEITEDTKATEKTPAGGKTDKAKGSAPVKKPAAKKTAEKKEVAKKPAAKSAAARKPAAKKPAAKPAAKKADNKEDK